MPLYDFRCPRCGTVFEAMWQVSDKKPACPSCGGRRTLKLPSAPAVHIKKDAASRRIAKRARDYLIDGKISEAARFLDRAAEHVKDERVLRLRDKVQRARAKNKRRT